MRRLIFALPFIFISLLSAQKAPTSPVTYTFSAAGVSPVWSRGYSLHSVQVNVTGGPATCSLQLEGSLDNANWANLSTAQACSVGYFPVVDRAVPYTRINLTALTGGTSPTVTVLYWGR